MTKVPLKKALWIIVLSTFLISGTGALCIMYFNYVKSKRLTNDAYNILAIVQTCSEKEPLKTVYLAELMQLSHDRLCNLYAFNVKEAKENLLKSPLIKEVEVQKILPGTVYVNYASRTPVAYLTDYSNTALDKEGIPIPFKPFFTPKNIPEITLGLEMDLDASHGVWGRPIHDRRLELALEVNSYISKRFSGEQIILKKIDVSQAYASSYGQRQLVVVFEEARKNSKARNSKPINQQHMLRLSTENYKQELLNYRVLKKEILSSDKIPAISEGENGLLNPLLEPIIIDLRVPRLAFIPKRLQDFVLNKKEN